MNLCVIKSLLGIHPQTIWFADVYNVIISQSFAGSALSEDLIQ